MTDDDPIAALERSVDDNDPHIGMWTDRATEPGKRRAALLLALSDRIVKGIEEPQGDGRAALARYYPDATLGTRHCERGWHAGIQGSFPRQRAWHLFPAETEQAAIWTALLVARASEHARWW